MSTAESVSQNHQVAVLEQRLSLSGDEAVARTAFDTGVALGSGCPGTGSTLEHEPTGKLSVEDDVSFSNPDTLDNWTSRRPKEGHEEVAAS